MALLKCESGFHISAIFREHPGNNPAVSSPLLKTSSKSQEGLSMKKSSFVAMVLGTIGGVLFALDMCMALIPLCKGLK